MNKQKINANLSLLGHFIAAPDENIDYFAGGLNQSPSLLGSNSNEIVILGDFNIDFTSKSSSKQKLNRCLTNDLHQLIKYPTKITEHSKTIIDLIKIIINNHLC